MRLHPRPRPLPILLLGAVALALGSCDNPACVFGGGCQDGGGSSSGGLGAQPATFPVDGEWISPSAPEVVDLKPEGSDVHPSTVIAIEFSESLSPDSLDGAFELFDTVFQQPLPFADPPPLAADGRIAILVPLAPLMAGNIIEVRHAEGSLAADLTGQELDGSGVIGNFAVSLSPPTEPQVIKTWPVEGTSDASDITEITAIFDRPMSAASFDTDSFAVTIDSLAPDPNPDPVPLSAGGGPIPVPVLQVWQWRSTDMDGQPVTLGEGGAGQLRLSPTGNELEDTMGNLLAEVTFDFDIAAFGIPVRSLKGPLSNPPDAIGRPNLNDSVPVIEVELVTPAQAGDTLRVVLFGRDLDGTGNIAALARTVDITSSNALIPVFADDLDLLQGGPTSDARFEDGPIELAVYHQRGGVQTAVRLSDADVADPGPQRLLLDVTPPTVLGFGTAGASATTFTSDLRDLTLVGLADEEIAEVEVTTAMGDNLGGGAPRVVSADPGGVFVARPVRVGVLDPPGPLAFTAIVRDHALNEAPAIAGTFRQVGAFGSGATLPGPATVEVSVFDATTLQPLTGALVFSHEDDTMGAFSFLDSDVTTVAGLASVLSSAAGETIVTVDLAGYDLFTFHGVPREFLDVPLFPTGYAQGTATTEGTVTGSVPLVSGETLSIGDTRRPGPNDPLFAVGACNPIPFACPYGPEGILSDRLGVQTFIAADFVNVFPPPAPFLPDIFLRTFSIDLPSLPVASGEMEVGTLSTGDLLLNGPPEERAIEIGEVDLTAAGATDLAALAMGYPAATVEGLSPGTPGSVVVGQGIAFPAGPDWVVNGAYPGVVDGIANPPATDLLGQLVLDEVIDADLLLRVDLADVDGNRVGQRPRLSAVAALAGPLDPFGVPRLLFPAPGGNTGGSSFNLQVANVVTDAVTGTLGHEGLYRVVLRDDDGRRWHLWRRDSEPDGVPDVVIRVPNIGAAGGMPLADGPLFGQVSAWSLPGVDLDTDVVLWTDVEREFEYFGHTLVTTFTQP